MFNDYIETESPKDMAKARVVALLKPGKVNNYASNFRPVVLLCHIYKLLERIILNLSIAPSIDDDL